MSLDIFELLASRADERFELHDRYVNPKMVRLLRTIDFDRHYVRARGPYLYDRDGQTSAYSSRIR